MPKIQQYSCANCYGVLYGKDRAAFIDKEYISITGQLTLQGYRWIEGENYMYLSPTKTAQMYFCNTECLREYIDKKKAQKKLDRDRILKSETDHKQNPDNIAADYADVYKY